MLGYEAVPDVSTQTVVLYIETLSKNSFVRHKKVLVRLQMS